MLVWAKTRIVVHGLMVEPGEVLDIPPAEASVACDASFGWATPVNSTVRTRRDLESRLVLAGIEVNEQATAMWKAEEAGDQTAYCKAESAWFIASREWTTASDQLVKLSEQH